MRIYENITDLIGNTPMLYLNKLGKDLPCKIAAKLEFVNPGHSIKDRPALSMVLEAEKNGQLHSGMTARFLTGIEIHPAARIGTGFFIDHGMGVVIGETAIIGKNVTLYHGVTLGGTSLEKKKRHPTIGDRVTIGAGAKILGDISIGEDSRIGANAVVVKSVPPNSVVVGIPGQVIRRDIPHKAQDKPDLHHERIPDVIGQRISELMQRVSALEEALTAIEKKGITERRIGNEEDQTDSLGHEVP